MRTSKQLKANPGDCRERVRKALNYFVRQEKLNKTISFEQLAKKFRLDEDELLICGEDGPKILAEQSTFTVGEEYGICCYLAKKRGLGLS